jgi:hypothetical protein
MNRRAVCALGAVSSTRPMAVGEDDRALRGAEVYGVLGRHSSARQLGAGCS